ncbi:ATP-dependent DNA helicase RecG [Frigoriflavimonas asaccharolytica]|uniref:ATP-dependent DNA helicase RecG n=1 Tax=Frigoriflavimonas asaccharolytica TaxID=2735899 RepID=A0A8J8GB01_9FLAO|nr:ATP-dependent DNA helicase RecG [Frigoriflavimonas asaccharolytica]NRS92347.1 ATP-dependent DNA helicase RecG [Frigoriflavimonas asaccharolytica]
MTHSTSIEFLKGIGPDRAKLLRDVLHIATVGDFLNYFPIRYLDKSKIYTAAELHENLPEVQLKGTISNLQEISYGAKKRLSAQFQDETGSINLVWFKYSKWLKDQIVENKSVFIYGSITVFNQAFSMAHPEIEVEDLETQQKTWLPIYSNSEKLSKRGINQKLFQNILKNITLQIPILIQENLPNYFLKALNLMSRQDAYLNVHFPKDELTLKAANRRLKFEEAFFFQLGYALKKQNHHTNAIGNPFPIVGDYFNNFFINHLPFDLTGAQKRVLKEIRGDMRKSIQMNRLLQGDVGSGKTMVALLTMLIALDNGFQSCLMAPTEILAQQHYNGISDLLEGTGITISLLTGSVKKSARKPIHENLLNGDLKILVGTHALLEPIVQFKNLGLAIIDEQHRFGVAQRAKLWAKNKIPPHILVMTATPIPRTLAMSFYSDLDVSVIDEMPIGRKPIITAHRREKDRVSVYNFCRDELKKGRQVYFVYPLIEESETLDYKNLGDGYAHIVEHFPEYKIGFLHGRMKPDEKDAAMQKFARGETHILVSTTVIEVGVNVPNASLIIIESSERFGLSQLHQLRGRVGRDSEQSYCILMTSDKLTNESRKRIKTMVDTNDGFKISEVDLEIRGPGDLLGTQQSGVLDFKKLNLAEDAILIAESKKAVEKLIEKDPFLNHVDHKDLKIYYKNYYSGKIKWGKIS